MTAPGILPVVISLRKYSPTRSSFFGEKADRAASGGSACVSLGTAAANAPSSASAAIQPTRRPSSVLHRLIDQLLHHRLDLLALRRRLFQEHEEHVLLAVDCEIPAPGAAPFQLAERAGRRRFGVAGIGAYAEAEPEPEPVARKVEEVAIHAGAGSNLVSGHLLIRLCAEIRLAGVLAAVEHHLREADKVRHGRNHSATAGLPFHRLVGEAFESDPEIAVVRHRLGDQLLPF